MTNYVLWLVYLNFLFIICASKMFYDKKNFFNVMIINPKVFKSFLPCLCSKLFFTGTLLIKTVLFFWIADQTSDNVFSAQQYFYTMFYVNTTL